MTLNIKQNGPVPEAQVAELEAALTVGRFPEAYRSWLQQTGGGTIGEYINIPGTKGNGLLSQIDGPADLVELQQLERNDVVPDAYVVISGGHGGALALRVRGDDVGSVWWVDYDVADEEDIYEPSERVMRRLADDFDSLLALL